MKGVWRERGFGAFADHDQSDRCKCCSSSLSTTQRPCRSPPGDNASWYTARSRYRWSEPNAREYAHAELL